ncbi:branched-chain amino acid ABC transporter permease [Castellaniella defragrans]|uniref:Branched-chain amino acid transport system permease protein n=1 Tax=Castellaniella defragrans TaxID=75697 RepID=A0A7W9TSW1_CASDE|nr:branched-chain amino acid ABC transporter permease [Castellaniella defragrans]KAB0620573.1 branched-chain amino acid ABC transporter permease [Castellaniella defragrans]MBB6085408.1 branched-chain amino acid transport system permease protein [Castellaniella defragrans]
MDWNLFIAQILNGVQLGMLLFLLSAGLTLVFGIMNFINLSHASFYMLGAYFAATAFSYTGSFLVAGLAGVAGGMLLAVATELLALKRLYDKNHLVQVLGTFGLIMFFNETARMIWGSQPVFTALPEWARGSLDLAGVNYPSYRMLIIVAGLLVAFIIHLLIHRTRIGMLVRASSTHVEIVSALGVNAKLVNTLLFSVGAGLAALAGWLVGPIVSVQSGMGDSVLILALVVIVIGGIGSIRGALYGALLVGMVDTMGRAYMAPMLRGLFERNMADAAGPALASMLIYLLMAVVLAIKPDGLFPVKR